MSTEGFKYQANFKVGNDLINVRSDDAKEFSDLLADLPHEAIAEARAALTGVAHAASLVNTGMRPVDPNIGDIVVDVPPTERAAQPAPVTAIGQSTTTDQYGNSYEWNLPGAPNCSHGTMPKKTGEKKDRTRYQTWVCAQLRGAVLPGLKATEGACSNKWID